MVYIRLMGNDQIFEVVQWFEDYLVARVAWEDDDDEKVLALQGTVILSPVDVDGKMLITIPLRHVQMPYLTREEVFAA